MSPVRINLISRERPKRRRALPSISTPAVEWLPRSPSVIVGLVGLVVVLALVFLYFDERREAAELETTIAEARADSARLHSEWTQVRSMEQTQQRLAARVEMLESVVEGRLYWIELLETLSREIPSHTWLQRIDRGELGPDRVRIDGATFSNAAVTEYMRALEASPQLADISLVGVTRVEDTAGPEEESIVYQTFTIVAEFEQYQAVVIAPPDTSDEEGE